MVRKAKSRLTSYREKSCHKKFRLKRRVVFLVLKREQISMNKPSQSLRQEDARFTMAGSNLGSADKILIPLTRLAQDSTLALYS